MAEEFFGEKATPTVLKYLMLTSTFAAGLVGIVSWYAAGSEGTMTADFLTFYAGINFGLMALSAIELAVLRKKISNARVIFGSFVELFRSAVYLNLPLISVRNFMNDVGRGEYDSYVTNNLGMQAVGMLGIASFASFLVVNFAYDRLAALGEKVVFRNVFNAIPAIVLILAYAASMGVFREALIGPRQQDDVATPAFAWDESLFSQYSTLVPGWDASDLLASYLNQFLAGLNDLDREILRYRDDIHPDGNGGAADQTFFRTESFAKYIYDVNTGTSTFERVADIEESNRYGVNTLYSSEPSNPDNAFSIKFNFTYSGSQWDGYIPTSWDTEDGNFVYGPDSSYPMKILESDGTTEVDSSEYSIVLDEESMIGVPRAIKTIITFNTPSTGYKSRYLAYDVPHKEMNAANLYAYSMEPDEWKNIPGLNVTEMEARFLQVPTGTELPTGYTDYWEWANYSMTLQTNVSERLSPYRWLQDVIVNNNLNAEGTNALYSAAVIANQIGNQFVFDWQMWKSEYTQALLGQYGEGERLGPEVGEDYVGWMYNRGCAPNGTFVDPTDHTRRLGGTAAHFAASLCMMLRNMSIPARTVTGYIGFNDAQASEAVITALYTHSWVEALIPLDTDLDDSPDRAEWVIFDADPRANSFYTLPPNSGNDVKWVYDVSLELLSDMMGTPWVGDDVYLDDTIYANVTVFSSSSEGAIQPKEDANVTLGFQEVGQTDFITIVTNQKTPTSGTVIIPFTYNASMRTIYGAGSASLTAYVNNTLIGDTPPYQAGALIGGVNISQPLTWYPFPSSYFGAAVLENHDLDMRTSTTPSATESTSQFTLRAQQPELSYNLKHKEANDQSQTRTSYIDHVRRLAVHLWSRTVCS